MPIVVTVAAAIAGAAAFEALKVPAGALLGAMVAVAVVNLSTSDLVVELPAAGRFGAFAALGWAIGQGVTRETVVEVRESFVPLLLIVTALLLFGGFLAFVLTWAGVLDRTTAFLAASPGALSQMSALGTALGANATLVATAHTLRVVSLVLVTPLIARLVDGAG